MSLNFTSIYGRWLGITQGSSAGTAGGQNKYLTGDLQGVKVPNVWFGTQGSEIAQFGKDGFQNLSSGSTATQITAGGVATLTSSSALTWIMAPPYFGAEKTICVGSTAASGTLTVALSTVLGGNFQSTLGSSFIKIPMLSAGVAVTLKGMSTSIWQIITNTASAAITT